MFELAKIDYNEAFVMNELSQLINHWRDVCENNCASRFCFSIDSSFVICRNEKSVLIYMYCRSKDMGELEFMPDVCMGGNNIPDLIMLDIKHFRDWYEFTCARTLMCNVKRHTVYDFFDDAAAMDEFVMKHNM